MSAIVDMLQEALPPELSGTGATTASSSSGVAVNARVQLFGSADLNNVGSQNTLALYLYRISIDPTMVGGYLRTKPGAGARTPEISVMLHFLMFTIADTAVNEISLMGWGFQQMAATPVIGADRLAAQGLVGLATPPAPPIAWDESDTVQVATEELTREELMRIWDTLPLKYRLTVPFVARGLRLTLTPDMRQYAPVVDRSIVLELTP
jgi:hypothetical protein